jgi:SAM-dependent methyltransferase
VTPAATLYARGLRGDVGSLRIRRRGGQCRPLPLDRWMGPVTAADESVLRRAEGPVLDVGCGPGRHVAGLTARGITAMGLDSSPAAVATARARGAEVVQGCVFGDVPRAGTWRCVLLLDGNIGIGGRPRALLRRSVSLGAPDVRVLVELDPPGVRSGRVDLRLEDGTAASTWFPWSYVAVDDIESIARGAGLRTAELWEEGERWFAALVAR